MSVVRYFSAVCRLRERTPLFVLLRVPGAARPLTQPSQANGSLRYWSQAGTHRGPRAQKEARAANILPGDRPTGRGKWSPGRAAASSTPRPPAHPPAPLPLPLPTSSSSPPSQGLLPGLPLPPPPLLLPPPPLPHLPSPLLPILPVLAPRGSSQPCPLFPSPPLPSSSPPSPLPLLAPTLSPPSSRRLLPARPLLCPAGSSLGRCPCSPGTGTPAATSVATSENSRRDLKAICK